MDRVPRAAVVVLLVTLVAGSGCSPRGGSPQVMGPPKPAYVQANAGEQHIELLKWDEGLAVMIVDSLGSSGWREVTSNHRTGSDFVQTGSVAGVGDANLGYKWVLSTADGKSAEFTIGETRVDLRETNVLKIDIIEGQVIVHQLVKNLSGLEANEDAVVEFVMSDPDLNGTTELDSQPEQE